MLPHSGMPGGSGPPRWSDTSAPHVFSGVLFLNASAKKPGSVLEGRQRKVQHGLACSPTQGCQEAPAHPGGATPVLHMCPAL
jgi:hypothetical protein